MKNFVDLLLKDQTTGQNILWANSEFGAQEIQPSEMDSIRPRHEKNRELQKLRTKTRAEIFTPPEVCELQNNLICAPFDTRHSWQDFVRAKFLEITCGEAPYLVNRYNTVTGEETPLDNRVGLLDRKLRVVGKETSNINDWKNFAIQAVQSCYGYEFQGDNLFLARRNVFETVKDFFRAKFNRELPEDFLSHVAEIVSWNLWQMDGLKFTVPFAKKLCRIKNWRTHETFMFMELFGM